MRGAIQLFAGAICRTGRKRLFRIRVFAKVGNQGTARFLLFGGDKFESY
jgi:hypothetical protein